MAKSINHLVWLGACAATEPEGILSIAKKATLIDARIEACETLRKNYSQESVQVVQKLFSPEKGVVNFKQYNLAEYSAINAPTGIHKIYPGLKQIHNESIESESISEVVQSLKLEGGDNLLVVDVLDINLALLESLEKSGHLELFNQIYVHSTRSPAYEKAATKEEIRKFMMDHGYYKEKSDVADPDFSWAQFVRHPLWFTLIKAQHHLSEEKEKNKSLHKDLEKYKQRTEEQSSIIEDLKAKIEKLQNSIEEEKKSKTLEIDKNISISQTLESLRLELESMKKTGSEKKDKILRLENENTLLIEENARLKKKQAALEQEMVKADAQISLVKDLLLK